MHDPPKPSQLQAKSLHVRIIARKIVIAREELVAAITSHYTRIAIAFCPLDASECHGRIPYLYGIKCSKNLYNLLHHFVLSKNNFDMVFAVSFCNLPCIDKIRSTFSKSCRKGILWTQYTCQNAAVKASGEQQRIRMVSPHTFSQQFGKLFTILQYIQDPSFALTTIVLPLLCRRLLLVASAAPHRTLSEHHEAT